MNNPSKNKQSNLRIGRYSVVNRLYYITTCTKEKQNFLYEKSAFDIIIDSLDYLDSHNMIKMVCCVVMPDHVHIVFQLTGGKTLSKVLHSFKSYTALSLNKMLERTGQLWQKQYHDHLIRDEEALTEIIKYCYENPVRVGIVEKPEEYSFFKIWEENIKNLL